jgi:hypothetical protein
MYLIEYQGGESGCPRGSVYGELVGYNWNSNDYGDSRFPNGGEALKFLTEYEEFDADFFYFGSEFICSEKMLEQIKNHKHGKADFVKLSVFIKKSGQDVKCEKEYWLVRSREIQPLLDQDRSVYEKRTDPRTGAVEQDMYHSDRDIYDLISVFRLVKKKQ